jgi:uncharacterized protein YlxP (DUF503 family)
MAIPDNVFKRIDQLIKKHDGDVTASMLVADARKASSPLHSQFTWDDEKCGIEHRLWEARRLIKRYNVVVKKRDPDDIMIHVPHVKVSADDKQQEGKYTRIRLLVDNISEYERALNEALKILRAAQRAVAELETAAAGREDDSAALLAVAMKAMTTAETALTQIH